MQGIVAVGQAINLKLETLAGTFAATSMLTGAPGTFSMHHACTKQLSLEVRVLLEVINSGGPHQSSRACKKVTHHATGGRYA